VCPLPEYCEVFVASLGRSASRSPRNAYTTVFGLRSSMFALDPGPGECEWTTIGHIHVLGPARARAREISTTRVVEKDRASAR